MSVSVLYFPKHWSNITKSDTTVLDLVAFQVGGAGTVVAQDQIGADTTFTCIAGQVIVGQFRLIKAATTATNITGAWRNG